ncbi:HNH endonuclease signature motif containing protein [Rhodococcus sp. SGAir0479]|uniref:HNH endonuclease signature motif containing protein n=1 Tax=Rhodococcus sp. SGAir0479 TaxID=2567884 RepID=UPI0010CD3A95|nr:HNH endonuclease signature motif containing protein [Rhodococcus sp. SGAir0479]QCQ92130.1 HNH endonuclease [Rhodococcus sp. SGAir0479]
MFDTGGGVGERAADDAALEAVRFTELSQLARVENAHAARKVLLAGELTLAALERDVQLRGNDIRDCGNEALAEVSIRLGCSHTMASHFCDLGVDLRLRLPLTRAAFLAGELDYARAWRIHRETVGLLPGTVALLEHEIVESARRLAPAALGREIRELIVRASPDEAATDRELAEAECRVKVRPVGPLSEFTAVLTAEQGQAAWQLVCEMAETVCVRDRRGRQALLVDAFMALVHGEAALPCTCEKSECPKAGGATAPSRRKPLVQITVDVATLLGLTASPAYLDGHGPIDPQLAQVLAEDATWQAVLTEMLDLATELGLVTDRRMHPAEEPEPDVEPESDTGPEPEPQSQSESESEPDEPRPGLGPHRRMHVFRTRGSRHRGCRLPVPVTRRRPLAGTPPAGVGTTAAAIERAVEAGPVTTRRGQCRGGHSGATSPPDGALVYRPDAATTAMVRTRDGHCRFPGCSVPAARCQLDHVVPFSHLDPKAGGWTVVPNLQCLCQFHHNLKTSGRFAATMLAGGVVVWTSPYRTTTLTLPGGAIARDPAPALTPRVPRRRGSGPARKDQPDVGPPPF